MAACNPRMTLEWELRMCEVDGRPGYFHTWEHYSRPVAASILPGGPPSGIVSWVCGIVEFSDGVEKVPPEKIKFCDEQNSYLCGMEKVWRERK